MIKYIEKNKIKQNSEFRIRTAINKSIANSLRKNGIVTPLILADDLTLIDGYSRLSLSREEKIPVLIENSLEEAFLKSVELNMLVNPYSEFEKAKVIKIASENLKLPVERIVKEVNPLLKFAKKLTVVNDCLSLFNLDKELFSLLEERKSPIVFALGFLKESVDNQKFLATFFREKRLSLSEIRIVYDLMYYVSKRQNVSYEHIVEQCVSQNLVTCLKRMRYPKYSLLSEELQRVLSNYKGYLRFPEDFEAGFFSFFAKISTMEDVEKAKEVLSKIEKDGEFWDFLKKAKGDD